MKKVDVHTAAAVLEDELFALSQDIRKARFAMDLLWDNLIPEEDLTDVPYEKLIVTDTMNNGYIEIISDYLFAASQKMADLYKLCSDAARSCCVRGSERMHPATGYPGEIRAVARAAGRKEARHPGAGIQSLCHSPHDAELSFARGGNYRRVQAQRLGKPGGAFNLVLALQADGQNTKADDSGHIR